MKKRLLLLACGITVLVVQMLAQGNQKPLFLNDEVINCTLLAPFDSIQDDDCKKPKRFEAIFSYTAHGIVETFAIGVKKRGKFRCESSICAFPPLWLNFSKKDTKTGLFKDQDKLKLVNPCKLKSDTYQNLVFREYLTYRILNLLTDYSLKAKLLKINYIDVEKTQDTLIRFGFVLEPPDDMANRTKGNLLSATNVHPNEFNRNHMTLIDIFQFMVGNTDWSTTEPHNILIVSTNPFQKPLPVPYDFDWSGIVNAPYAIPAESLGLRSVSERLYMGFCRTPDEFNHSFEVFNQKKEEIYKLIQEFEYLPVKDRSNMINYLDEFYRMINSSNAATRLFQNWCK